MTNTREGGGGGGGKGCSTGWSDSKEKGKEDYGLGLKRSGERKGTCLHMVHT